MKTQILVLCVIAAALFSSCSGLRIEKRHYSKGFYVDFNTGNDQKASVEKQTAKAEENGQREAPAAAFVAAVEPSATEAPAAAQPSGNPRAAAEPATTPEQPEEITAEPGAPVVAESTPPAKEAPATIPHGDVALILLVILAILLPPLAVFLAEGLTSRFWITLILCLLGGGFFFSPYIGLLWLIAIIIALMVVLGAL